MTRHSIPHLILGTTVLLATITLANPVRAQGTQLQGVATVIDGDTLELHGQRIRLFGIDAPESGQSCTDALGNTYRCGQQAALALSDRIGRKPITCEQHGTDRYGRIIAICRQGAINLNLWMVANGQALAYRRYSSDYVAQEDMARHNKRGIWAGSFTAPWDWRKGSRGSAIQPEGSPPARNTQAARQSDCRIKGNISQRSGDRIYHMPGQQHYTRTRINPDKGELWFCSEAEARAAGWRRAKR